MQDLRQYPVLQLQPGPRTALSDRHSVISLFRIRAALDNKLVGFCEGHLSPNSDTYTLTVSHMFPEKTPVSDPHNRKSL